MQLHASRAALHRSLTANGRSGSISTDSALQRHFRFPPYRDRDSDREVFTVGKNPQRCLLWLRSLPWHCAAQSVAKCHGTLPTLMHRSNQHRYSITSVALISSVCGTMRPSAFAVLRLIKSWNLVGVCTGRSAGFAPLRMRSTYPAARRYWSTWSIP